MISNKDDNNQIHNSAIQVSVSMNNSSSNHISYHVLQTGDISSVDHLQNSRSKCFGRCLILFNAVCYGTTLSCIHILSFSFLLYPSVSCFTRFLLASLCFFPQFIFVWNKLTKVNLDQRNKLLWFAVEIGTYQFFGYLGQYQSIFSAHEKASNVSVISSLSIVVVSFMDFFFTQPATSINTKPDDNDIESNNISNDSRLIILFLKATAVFLSVNGIIFIELSTFLNPDDHSLSITTLWSFLQPFFFGLGIWKMEKYIYICENDSLLIQAFCFIILSTITILSFLWLTFDLVYPEIRHFLSSFFSSSVNSSVVFFPSIVEQFISVITDWKIILIVSWISLIVTALLTFNDTYALNSISAVDATIIYLTDPLWVTMFALVFIGEVIEWHSVVGAVFILSACLVSSCQEMIVKKFSFQFVSGVAAAAVSSTLSVNDP
jgi:drug/metabolite transporter (DMT)-like permease